MIVSLVRYSATARFLENQLDYLLEYEHVIDIHLYLTVFFAIARIDVDFELLPLLVVLMAFRQLNKLRSDLIASSVRFHILLSQPPNIHYIDVGPNFREQR